ncbi:class I SAM-dependent methyltransferase [Gordonia sp. 'Campus']|uniref:class I SAM-dependent methyltransferase n=1 Tax=Gordonia sp. 'Campus' TaxID=2915824 RepID=UPI001EE4C927|nr:methyltransferase domain-containing protein [Gordonia sp. 'Campus']
MTTSITPDLVSLRAKQQMVWSSGDYNRIAALTVPVNEATVAAASIIPGERVLDVATGTGHSALAAARQGAVVTAIDYVPALLDIARHRADAEHLDVDYVEAPAEILPFGNAAFDVGISTIGIMFAADHEQAARELARVVRPDGRIVVTSWTADGFVGGMLATVGKHVTPPPGARPATRWGDQAYVAELFGNRVESVGSRTGTLTVRFVDAAAFADLFLGYYGPTFSAASKLDDDGRTALRADLIALAQSHQRSVTGGIALDWEYRVVEGVRA